MSETLATVGLAADALDKSVRIPANIFALLRQSYDTREKVLDWCLAFGVAAAMVYVWRDDLTQIFWPADLSPDAGRDDPPVPNNRFAGAFPASASRADLYSYAMPSSRRFAQGRTTSGTRPPGNPSSPPTYEADCP